MSTAAHTIRLRGKRHARRFLALPWRKIALVAAIVMALVVFVPPLRRLAIVATSRVILIVATPIAPSVADFSKLPEAGTLRARNGTVIGTVDGKSREPVKLAALPDYVKRAVLAAEDKRFYQHGGVDPSAIVRAALHTTLGHREGGSTITQQLAKLNFTNGQRTVLRKLKEVLYATELENHYSKDQLLERYVNQVYFGEGAYGLGPAARSFFGTTADKLTPAQAATLAGKIRSPEGLDPRTHPAPVIARRNQVLGNMRDENWITKEQYRAAVAEPMTLTPPSRIVTNLAPHFTEFVKREARTLSALGGDPDTRAAKLFTGGFTIDTTLDTKVYNATVAAVRKRLGADGDPTTAAATVVPGDGAIRSLFGGLDFATTQFDMASLGGRQAGSSFKPFVYMAALREGIDPRSRFNGTSGRHIPCYGDKPVDNYAGEDAGGVITVDDALVHSVNVVFVDLGCQVGVRNVVQTARDDGIPDDATSAQGAVFLGGLDGKGVNALEMASAFATFAAEGKYAQPYSIARITDRSGHVIYEHSVKTKQVFERDQVGVINNPLQGVVRNGTGAAASIGRPVIGKTGTTQDNVDAWFIGATPQLATGVWVGYDRPKPMSSVHGRAVTGGSFPAQIFGDLMRSSLRGVPSRPIYTASPDSLDLHTAGRGTTPRTSPDETTTTESIVVPDTVLEPEPTTTPTTDVPRETTPTTTPRRPTTTQKPSPTTSSTVATQETPSGQDHTPTTAGGP